MMAGVHRLSTEEVTRVSRARFIQISSQEDIDLSTIQHFFDASQFGPSSEEIKDVELALLLLASAHKVGNKQFDDVERTATVANFKDLKEDMFELTENQVVAILAPSILKMVKAQPGCLKSLFRVLRNLNPSVIVTVELEVSLCSSIFMDRFVEALLFYSSCYDCIQVCINDDPNRITLEACLGEEIRDTVVAKDEKGFCSP
ncbi:hypothetical protein GH714_025611 [Hevea brasiliensis]|uniref:Uncharacterized protein n=1 Tax=Hevea brasiliensis TaxID=3981 RepID=A0A6A6KLW2_HEVBR|nr:hypothetical protein GH714_025611 [Hevea brasiliensis]